MVRAAPIILLIAGGLTFLAGLGRPAIGDSDEAFYAESAREMIESGDWLTPHYNYEYRFQKPILYYWLTAATYLVAGIGPGTARLWSALSGFGLVFIAWVLGRRWYGERSGLVAGLITATSFGAFTLARLALPDMPLAFFVSLSIWAVIAAGDDQGDSSLARLTPGTTSTVWRWTVAAAAAALGVLTKGPLGILLPALVILPTLALDRRLRDLAPRNMIPALLVFAVIALPWYVAMTMEHGTSYVYGFLVGDNLERFATGRFNEPRPFWFYAPILAGGMLPWTPFMLLWTPRLRGWLSGSRRVDPRDRQLLIWVAAPLLFFSVSVGKQPRYILPVLPPIAILLAATIVRATDERDRNTFFAASAVLSGSLLALLGLLVWRARSLLIVETPASIGVASLLIAACGAGVLLHASTGSWRGVPFTLSAAGALTLLALQYGALSSGGREPVEEVAASIRKQHPTGGHSGPYQVLVRNLVFYTGFRQADLFDARQLTEFLDSPDRVLCVLPARVLQDYEATRSKRFRRLAEVPYFNVSTVKLKALLWPDPQEDVETVVVVSNR
ncbi:MAG: glycosyltransferase family 39 protein [Acidobacteria bacterium]|nr:glycosyltransferase family 39 protein [Acidobacteriota bacterium]